MEVAGIPLVKDQLYENIILAFILGHYSISLYFIALFTLF